MMRIIKSQIIHDNNSRPLDSGFASSTFLNAPATWHICKLAVASLQWPATHEATYMLSRHRRTIELACRFHAGQKRKSGEPYSVHPLRAMMQAVILGITDARTLGPLLLHDVIEECTDLSLDKLVDEFGVSQLDASIVSLLTKRKTQSVEEYLYGIRQSREASIAKLSDRLENLCDAPFIFPPSKVQEYLDETEFLLRLCESKPSRPDGYAETMRALEYEMKRAMVRARLVLSLKARNGRFTDIARVFP